MPADFRRMKFVCCIREHGGARQPKDSLNSLVDFFVPESYNDFGLSQSNFFEKSTCCARVGIAKNQFLKRGFVSVHFLWIATLEEISNPEIGFLEIECLLEWDKIVLVKCSPAVGDSIEWNTLAEFPRWILADEHDLHFVCQTNRSKWGTVVVCKAAFVAAGHFV